MKSAIVEDIQTRSEMVAKSIDEIVEPDIQELKDAGIQEGKTIEYKRELPGAKDEE